MYLASLATIFSKWLGHLSIEEQEPAVCKHAPTIELVPYNLDELRAKLTDAMLSFRERVEAEEGRSSSRQ